MNTHSHDFVTVDMRALKAVLVARSHAERVSVSTLVRRAVSRELRCAKIHAELRHVENQGAIAFKSNTVKLSIRFTVDEAWRLAAGARTAGLSHGAYLAGLVAGVPVLTDGASRGEHLAALIAANAELATLSRNIHHLTTLLRQGAVRPAMEYRAMLDTLDGDVRAHLALAARVLADLRPRSAIAGISRRAGM